MNEEHYPWGGFILSHFADLCLYFFCDIAHWGNLITTLYQQNSFVFLIFVLKAISVISAIKF